MRKVRPGEVPALLSIWRWRETGDPLLVLGFEEKPASWGGRYHITVLRLPDGDVDDAIWTGNAHVGMGPVLEEWICVDEGPAGVPEAEPLPSGHSGTHRGSGGTLNGDPCPKYLHHHHDEKCVV